jgi:YVTN family beta-propeller protein
VGLAAVAIALIGAACSGGDVSKAVFDESQAALKAREAELAAAQKDLAAAKQQIAAKDKDLVVAQEQAASVKTITIVQAGELKAAPAGAQASGWDTAESIRGGLKLVASYDSSGPDAWDAKAHPLVYFSSEGTENESIKYDKDAPYFAGFHIVDAYSKQVVASALFNVGREITAFPHGVMTSPDGKWAYVGWGQRTADGKATEGVVAVVNVRTLKIDKVMKQESYYQGALRSQRLHHIQTFKDWQGRDRVILQWGFGADGGPHFILDPNDDNRVVRAITYDDVKPMGHPFTTPSPDGKFIYISMGSPAIREAPGYHAAIAKLNLETGAVIVIPEVGSHPIGITHSQDGKFTYVVDGTNSLVFKIDNATNKVVAKTSAGVAGPYGIAFNWDESLLYVVGKGEGSHNKGGVLGVINAKTFTQTGIVHEMPIWLGGSASSVDHAILHPDPAVNELWVSNMNGWETIVLDLKTNKPKAYIPTPNGGNTHSGGFVRYNADWTGEVQSDMGGPKSKTMKDMVKAKVAAAAAAAAAK